MHTEDPCPSVRREGGTWRWRRLREPWPHAGAWCYDAAYFPDTPMKTISLLLLRISLGWLMVVWGIDKLTNPDHGQAVAESFYLGLGSGATFLTLAGIAQVLLGLLVVVGWLRRFTWPVLALVNGITLLAVWKSVVDPWGFVLEGGNLVFYSSAVIFAGILVGWSHMDDDELALDARSAAWARKVTRP